MSRERRSKFDVVSVPRANRSKPSTPKCLSRESRRKSTTVKPKKKVNSVESQDYYHGYVDKEDSFVLLKNPGEFLIRSEMTKDGRRHVLDIVTPEGKKVSYPFQESNGMFFLASKCKRSNIPSLLSIYRNHDEGLDPAAERPVKPLYPVKSASWILDYHNVVIDQPLGEGNFGTVYTGIYYPEHTKSITVAIKVSKNNKEKELQRALSEANIMRHFHHPHVVQLYGVCTQQDLLIVMEYVDGGAVSTILEKAADDKNPIAMEEKIQKMLLPAGWGIEYLHHQKIVHRDIAARNCLYSQDKVLKISDFGLSRPGEVYKVKNRRGMPYRHYPPEALSNEIFSQSGDVWSFGVYLWELMNDAKPPHPQCRNIKDLTLAFCSGYRFELTPNTPQELMPIFKQHVLVKDSSRKPMTEINIMLEEVLNIEPCVANKQVRKEKKQILNKTTKTVNH